MHPFEIIAEAYRYPGPGRLDTLRKLGGRLRGNAGASYDTFLDAVGRLTLAEWEELHTRTLDLSPILIPYVGHVVYGEDYRRGVFMAALNRAQLDAGIEQDGELPDHLIPVLRYLAAAEEPLDDLLGVFPKALDRMIHLLRKSEGDNPYVHLAAATRAAATDEIVTVGGAT